jgi:hypothetical protein
MNKQETLEEAAERYGSSIGNKDGTAQFDFIKGAKYQSERMYSGEEVESLLHKFMQSQKPDWHDYSTTKWFEKFKKK